MPIYEFYCSTCHRIFNFLSTRVETEKQPSCPKCGKKRLSRQVSKFAALKKGRSGKDTEADDEGMPDIDEAKLERAMATLASEAEGMDENDPKQAANLMRKLQDMTGISLGDGMEEALARLEAGEDPEQIEAEMGDLMNDDKLLLKGGGKKIPGGKALPPTHDEELYTL
jgi:putative FmdB family regulatory protein